MLASQTGTYSSPSCSICFLTNSLLMFLEKQQQMVWLLGSCNYAGDPEEALGSGFPSGQVLAAASIWGVKQWREEFLSIYNFAFQINKYIMVIMLLTDFLIVPEVACIICTVTREQPLAMNTQHRTALSRQMRLEVAWERVSCQPPGRGCTVSFLS